jgi:hypothetical protein
LTTAEAPSPRPSSAPPAQFITQAAPPPPPSFTKDNVTPKPATPYTPPPQPATPYAPPPPPAHPTSGHSISGDPADRPSDRGADRVRDQAPNRASDPAPKPSAHSTTPSSPPPASQAANFQPPPNIAPNVAEAGAHRNQGGGTPSPTGSFNGQTNALRGGGDADGLRRQPVGDEKSRPPVGAKLIIQRGGKVGKEFPLSGTEAMIGRWDADGGIFPHIDLDQDDPEAKVSRRHAKIQFLNNQYLIEDLGSTNGTFVNRGPRLAPGAKQPLKNGDEIIVGKTFLKFVLS